jgi:hypothetical protein
MALNLQEQPAPFRRQRQEIHANSCDNSKQCRRDDQFPPAHNHFPGWGL